jgi:predicted DsbA family dithiol-disulfide isomerase
MKVEIYSDVVCPWCYIGKRRFQRALAELAGRAPEDEVEVVFRPYQLDPNEPAAPRPLLESLRRKFGPQARAMTARVSEAARGEGIEIDWDRAVAVNTLPAHRLLWLAEREAGPAVQRALAERLFEAHFARGENVGDPAALARLAGEAGLDPARAAAMLATDEGEREVREAIAQARRLGITAVPTFVFDGEYGVQGAQPPEVFREVFEELAARPAGPAAPTGRDA